MLWVLGDNDTIRRWDADFGCLFDRGVAVFPVNGAGDLAPFFAAAILNVQYVKGPDNCLENAVKLEPGICRCEFYDVPGPDFYAP